MHHPPDVAKRAATFCASILLLFATLAVAHARNVTLAWDPNTEPDLAGYRVYYGTESGVYSNTLDVGNATQVTISNLTTGIAYYFVVTAYNTLGIESLPSEQVSFFLEENPPPPPPSIPTISSLQRNLYGAVELTVHGNQGRTHHVWVSDNLRDWTILTTVLNTGGTVQIVDTAAAGAPQRFYKISVE
jgi:hypothetical protein